MFGLRLDFADEMFYAQRLVDHRTGNFTSAARVLLANVHGP